MLLDRRKVKFWQRIVFGGMAFLMAAFLIVGYSGVLNGCTLFNSAEEDATAQVTLRITRDQAAVKTDPKDAAAWKSLAVNYADRANLQVPDSDAQTSDWQQAAAAYVRANKLLAKQKGAAAKRERLDVLQQLVVVYAYLRDNQSATSVYGEITGLQPKDPESFFNLGQSAIQAGDVNTALLAFTKFLELDPKSPEAPAVKDWIAQNSPSSSPTPTPSPTK